MILKILSTGTVLAGMLVPSVGLTYFNPEDIFSSTNFYQSDRITPRSAEVNVDNQLITTTERREAEHALLEKAFQDTTIDPIDLLIAEELGDEEFMAAAPVVETPLSAREESLIKAIELLDARQVRQMQRVEDHQFALANNLEPLHGGAPLAPTGAGGWLSAIVMLGAVGFTLWRVYRKERNTVVLG